MAKLTGDVLIDRLCSRMAWSSPSAAQRAAALRLLNEADDWLSAVGGHKYLVSPIRTPLTDSAGSTFLVPEPYEVSIILRKAEYLGKSELRAIVTDQERKDFELVVSAFLSRPQLAVTTAAAGKLPGTELVTRLCERMSWPTGPAPGPTRSVALRLLREADDWFSSLASHKYLERTEDLVLANLAETVAIPAWVDMGKAMTLTVAGRPVTIKPSDQFRRHTQYAYQAWGTTTPTECTIEGAAAGTMAFRFSVANGTGGGVTYRITAQQLRTALVDTGGSVLMIPETYETSIILERAEIQAKRENDIAVPPDQLADLGRVITVFLDQFRSTREVPKPDSEQVKRKQAEEIQEGR